MNAICKPIELFSIFFSFQRSSKDFIFAFLTLKVASQALTSNDFDLLGQNQSPSWLLATGRARLCTANGGAAALQLTNERAALGPARAAYACSTVRADKFVQTRDLLDRPPPPKEKWKKTRNAG